MTTENNSENLRDSIKAAFDQIVGVIPKLKNQIEETNAVLTQALPEIKSAGDKALDEAKSTLSACSETFDRTLGELSALEPVVKEAGHNLANIANDLFEAIKKTKKDQDSTE